MSAPKVQYGNFAKPGTASLEGDIRADPGLVAGMSQFGMGGRSEEPPGDREGMSTDDLVNMSRQMEGGFEQLFGGIVSLMGAPDESKGLAYAQETLKNPDDGHEIVLHIHRPENHTGGPLPGVAYIHGGGMVILDPYAAHHKRWAMDLARTGLVTINVCYRNANVDAAAGSGSKYASFPTGLNDCVTAVHYIAANRERLGISKLMLEGESGGGNLVLATTIKTLRDGHKGDIDGVYARVPYISGAYHQSDEWKLDHGLNSMIENEGIFLTGKSMGLLTAVYDPGDKNATNPLAWPWYATEADLKDFPPTMMVMDELDPLRDEGMQLARKMAKAGVPVVSRMNMGMIHASEMMGGFVPLHYKHTIRDIKGFADSLT